MSPEMAARYRLAELREKKGRYGPPPLTPAQDAAFRVLTLLYPRAPNPEPSEIFLAEHPFRDLPVPGDDPASSPKPPKRPASTNPQPNPDEDFVEFVDVLPFATVDRELSEKKGRTKSNNAT
jgi:hypothetical protein